MNSAGVSNSLRVAKVTKSHPEAYSVDLVFLDTGAEVPMVKVMSWSASTNTGAIDLPAPTPPGDSKVTATKDRDILAVVGNMGGLPIVMGFLPPEVCQVLFDEPNRRIMRHASDVYTSIDDKGNFELFHPSGSYIRIGESAAHEDLTGKDFDKKWAIVRNTDKQVHMHLSVHAGGARVASLDLGPDGTIAATATANLNVTVGGNAAVAVTGNASVAIDGNLTSRAAAWSHTGPLTVHGDVTAVGGDVTADSISLKTHKHGGVTTGANKTLVAE